MSDWAWVAAGFGTAYGAVGLYLLSLRLRRATISLRAGGPR